uniref:Protein FAM117B n=1 Tax=Phallusia mammillata TaxID=59560 RepID=A0A6F9DCI9_9ASCI|nr:protein FAM117B [Phallusia mammillata]
MASNKSKSMHKTGSARLQPIRATQPFQLKSPSSSPTPRPTSTAGVTVRNRWPADHRSSPDRNDRKSPNSPSIKVSNRRSPSPSIRRTSSLDTIAGPYLTGQWPRDGGSTVIPTNHNQYMRDKTTQTPDWSVEANSQTHQQVKSGNKNNHGRSTSIAEPDFKQIKFRQQIRLIGKRHGDKKDRTPPVPGNHAALHQLPTQNRSISNPISIGVQPFGRVPRRQNSTEALNKEIDMLISPFSTPTEISRVLQGVTPPDGHRAPIPRSSTRSMETQTPQGLSEYIPEGSESSHGSPTPSPTVEQVTPNLSRNAVEIEGKDSGISPGPKYASSPRPNNSYMFKREPPEGAESVKPFKEQDPHQQISPSCPDKNKVNFHPRMSSAFVPAFKSKLQCESAVGMGAVEQNNNLSLAVGLHASLIAPVLEGIQQLQTSNNNSNNNSSSSSPLLPTSDVV